MKDLQIIIINIINLNENVFFIPNLYTIYFVHRYRDVYVALRGVLKRWGTNFGVDVKWDVNRDPSQKFLFNIKTMSEPMIGGMLYSAKSIFEYPGHTSMASLGFLSQGNVYVGEPERVVAVYLTSVICKFIAV